MMHRHEYVTPPPPSKRTRKARRKPASRKGWKNFLSRSSVATYLSQGMRARNRVAGSCYSFTLRIHLG